MNGQCENFINKIELSIDKQEKEAEKKINNLSFWGDIGILVGIAYSMSRFAFELVPRVNKVEIMKQWFLEYMEVVTDVFVHYYDDLDEGGFGRAALRQIVDEIKDIRITENKEKLVKDLEKKQNDLPNAILKIDELYLEMALPSITWSNSYKKLELTILSSLRLIKQLKDQGFKDFWEEAYCKIQGKHQINSTDESISTRAMSSIWICFRTISLLSESGAHFSSLRFEAIQILHSLLSTHLLAISPFDSELPDIGAASKAEILARIVVCDLRRANISSQKNLQIITDQVSQIIVSHEYSYGKIIFNEKINLRISSLQKLLLDLSERNLSENIHAMFYYLINQNGNKIDSIFPILKNDGWISILLRIAELEYINENAYKALKAIEICLKFALKNNSSEENSAINQELQNERYKRIAGICCPILTHYAKSPEINTDIIESVVLSLDLLRTVAGLQKFEMYCLDELKEKINNLNTDIQGLLIYFRCIDYFEMYENTKKLKNPLTVYDRYKEKMDKLGEELKNIENEEELQTIGDYLGDEDSELEDGRDIERSTYRYFYFFKKFKNKHTCFHALDNDSAEEVDRIIADYRGLITGCDSAETRAISIEPILDLRILIDEVGDFDFEGFKKFGPERKSNRVYRAILRDPNEVSNIEKLYVIPDGDIYRIPFNGLLSLSTYTKKMTEKKIVIPVVTTCFSVTHLISTIQKSFKHRKTKQSKVIFANPDFSVNGKYESPLEPMLNSEKEASYISSITGAKIFKGSEATRQRFLNLQNPLFLHIATHMFFDDIRVIAPGDMAHRYGPYLPYNDDEYKCRKAIALAGAGRYFHDKDKIKYSELGVVSGIELRNMKLKDTRLVFFSACESGMVDKNDLSEFDSFAYDASIAGAHTVIGTLWPIRDDVALSFSKLFYKEFTKNISVDIAFRRSINRIAKKYPDTKSWSGFVLYGALNTNIF